MEIPVAKSIAQQILTNVSREQDMHSYKWQILSQIVLERARAVNIPLEGIDENMYRHLDEKQYTTVDIYIAQCAFLKRLEFFGMGPSFIPLEKLAVTVANLIKSRALKTDEFELLLLEDYVATRVKQLGIEKDVEVPVVAKALIQMDRERLAQNNKDFDLMLLGYLINLRAFKTPRRKLLRKTYAEMNEGLPAHEQIDVIFFFGIPNTVEGRNLLEEEQKENPNDVIVTDIPESRDDGKMLEWFLWARENMYMAHPDNFGEWCPKYLYIGKGDDDAVFHLERLGTLVRGLNVSTNFVGNYHEDIINGFHVKAMTGMLYLLSPQLVEWIKYSPVPRQYLHGIEDVQIAVWLQKSLINFVYMRIPRNTFHDYMYSTKPNNYYDHPITSTTVVVHYCKELEIMKECIAQIYGEASSLARYGAVFSRSSIKEWFESWQKVVELSKLLEAPITEASAKSLFAKVSKITDFEKYKFQIMSHIVLERAVSTTIPLLEINNYIFKRLDEKFYETIDHFIAERALVKRMEQLGMGVSYSAANIIAFDIADIIKHRPLRAGEFDLILCERHVFMRQKQLEVNLSNSETKTIVTTLLKLDVPINATAGYFDFELLKQLVLLRAQQKKSRAMISSTEMRRLSDGFGDYVTFNASNLWEIVDSNMKTR
ncbi:UNVERIFIED_CONTAM: hypothetical protein HDU68_007520 [Siphonaria sp. JEL0065]|nr:hypothetical protein HDU68_007520 [Siphonaria sp. JEL0065]